MTAAQTGPNARRRGNLPYVASPKDRQMVKIMIAGGIKQPVICSFLGIGVTAFRKHYRHELLTGQAEIDALVVTTHLQLVRDKNIAAVIWWEKARMGWSERLVVADGGVDDSDVSALSDQQLEARIAQLRRNGAARVARAG